MNNEKSPIHGALVEDAMIRKGNENKTTKNETKEPNFHSEQKKCLQLIEQELHVCGKKLNYGIHSQCARIYSRRRVKMFVGNVISIKKALV